MVQPKLDVLVVGSTGRQGGAVARSLLQGAHHVRAMTRTLAHPAADTLRLRGARLAWANIDDMARLEDVARGVTAIFAVTTARGHGAAVETQHGLALIELARRLEVEHLVYSSSMAASSFTGVPELDSKHEIEQYLRTSGVPHTIVCPGFFMEDLLRAPLLDPLRRGELSLPMSANRKLQQIAMADIGRFVRVVLEQREAVLGKRICIASDELTPIEMAATLARVAGQRIQHDPLAPYLREHDPGTAALFDWLDRNDGCSDVVALRSTYPQVNWHTLDGWAKRQDWSVLRVEAV
ncbi:MAG TPA: NmrA/HSCARG family protein [Longimicrobiales bacterium]|nr:NmrA/HSCARG family protein [Longimicrobiales bacterium]